MPSGGFDDSDGDEALNGGFRGIDTTRRQGERREGELCERRG